MDAALQYINIDICCLVKSCIFISTYCAGIGLFMAGDSPLSSEGTAQGDPLISNGYI